MALFSFGGAKGKTPREVDFNFPQDVSKNALSDLQSAFKSKDGRAVTDALVRYSLAQSNISPDNMNDIVKRIEDAINREQRPEYRAMMRLLEARVFLSYSEGYGTWDREALIDDEDEETTPTHVALKAGDTDYSEWSPLDFKVRVDSLLMSALSESEALAAVPITDLGSLVVADNKLSFTVIPTVLTFVCMDVGSLTADSAIKERAKKLWDQYTRDNVPAHIYYLVNETMRNNDEIYEEYKDHEWSGYALRNSYYSSDYALLKDYVARFPNSLFTAQVSNNIKRIEEREMRVWYNDHLTSRDSLTATVRLKNLNRGVARLYRLPDDLELKGHYDDVPVERLTLVAEREVTATGTIPFESEIIKINFGRLPYGRYIIIPAYNAGGKERTLVNGRSGNVTLVYDINTFNVITEHDDRYVVVVDAATGKPLQGVTIKSREKQKSFSAVSDADGIVMVPATLRELTYYAVCGDDRYMPSRYISLNTPRHPDYISVELYTDLGIYRPGETVHLAGIVYSGDGMENIVQANCEYQVELRDAAYNKVSSHQVKTDDYGRFTLDIDLPTDRMNGSWDIVVKGRLNNSTKSIEVSEYKTPTFEVEWTDPRRSYVNRQPVKLTGRATTYSGMPIQYTDVQISVRKHEWAWWWHYSSRDRGDEVVTDTVRTDAQGNFTLTVPAEAFPDNNASRRSWWSLYRYSAIATVTTATGETHEATTGFIIGTRRGIEFTTGDIEHRNTTSLRLPLRYNTTSETETWVPCTWEVRRTGETEPVLTGNLNTNEPVVDLTSLPSGEYRIKVHILDAGDSEDDADAIATLTLYRLDDKTCAKPNTVLWVPQAERVVDDKTNEASFIIATSAPEAHVYMVISDRTRVLQKRWLHYKPGLHTIKVMIPRQPEEYINVHLVSCYQDKSYTTDFAMYSAANADELNVAVQSFRNKLVPGEREHWTFNITGKAGAKRAGAMMLEMYDKALNALSPNPWSLHRPSYLFNPVYVSSWSLGGSNLVSRSWTADMDRESADFDKPSFYLYDHWFFAPTFYVDRLMMSDMAPVAYGAAAGRPMLKSRALNSELYDNVVEEAEALEEDAELKLDSGTEQALDAVEMRMADVKTALWLPNLTSNADGTVTVEFDAPQFNTTWLVQAIAWDKQMYSGNLDFEVLTQKPIMVKANPPRFVRHGDRITLAAAVQNATEEATDFTAVIELFDPRTEAIYATRTLQGSLGSKGSDALTIDWDVPADIPFVGLRVKAVNGNFGDGEQVMIPVLEASQPVIETTPFYIEAGVGHTAIDLPVFPDGARVTLEYCDNPVWYCATALPTIFDGDYVTASSLAHNLFALQLAQGIAASQPNIKQAIDYWKANEQDSTLVSMLARNSDLKIGTLLASPWLREADRQTLRMSKLSELFDAELMATERERIISRLDALQNADGGFSWIDYPGRESSLWATGLVLELMGELKHLGYLNADERFASMLKRAVAYYDTETLNQLNRVIKLVGKKNVDYSDWGDYVYTRQMYSDIALPKANADLTKKVLKSMNNDWGKGLSHGEKAFYALTLNRGGYGKTAARIVESLRQFAITKPNLGMYWDNVTSGWRYYDKVGVTSRILQAFHEIDPRVDEIDLMRKWMLLMKQTNDWGSCSLASGAVYTLLSTGTNWLERAPLPTVTVAGEKLEFDRVDQWLGYARRSLDASTTGQLVIDRQAAGPAWGSVYVQYVAPMTSIEAASIDDLSITKQLAVYQPDGTVKAVTGALHVGDKVQVRLTIKNARDLDYVTVVDERAACFEPVDQTSGYRYADRIGYYHETKDVTTRLFFNDLYKGTHVVTYDVYVMAPGKFSMGIATVQSQYAPQETAHSAGDTIAVE